MSDDELTKYLDQIKTDHNLDSWSWRWSQQHTTSILRDQ
jgi:hypothetical protein